jgi:epoxyqueuosine reductase
MCAINYYSKRKNPHLSRYVTRRDYHTVLRERFDVLYNLISDRTGSFNYRVFVDSFPALERYMACKAGLGFIGKNTMLINPEKGSFLWLGGIYTDLDPEHDTPLESAGCGECDKCMKTCPGGAFKKPYILDARKCLSYWTISYKGEELPENIRDRLEGRIFGCDDCQDCCPYNENVPESTMEPLYPDDDIGTLEDKARKSFRKYFGESVMYGIGKKRIIRNI